MNDLEKYFRQNNGRLIGKWIHYFDIYDKHFSQYRGKPVNILEIGVFQGGSLQMWKHYFGDKANIYGVDINPVCKEFEEKNIKIFIGSQSDRKFLRELKKAIPQVDILIDDGGHTMKQQIVTFEELFGHIKHDGIYLCEDVHTSYWIKFGGGHKRRGTFIEYSKNLIDRLNAYHSEQRSLKANTFTESVNSIHYYDSVVVIEKCKRGVPYAESIGKPSFQDPDDLRSESEKKKRQKARKIVNSVNSVARFFRLPNIIKR